ncbi:MAG: hypothetical protein ACP5PQ_03815 [Thermoproteota archaeon]
MKPSFSRSLLWFSAPPGYFSFRKPPAFSVRQWGKPRFSPSLAASSAAFAAIVMKMPVVMVQQALTLCLLAILLHMTYFHPKNSMV